MTLAPFAKPTPPACQRHQKCDRAPIGRRSGVPFPGRLTLRTDFGLRVRGAMQNRDMAEALGTNTSHIYLLTFGIGSGLAGLSGAIYAPLMSISPFLGDGFLWRAFTVVIVGGADPLVGPLFSSLGLGLVYSVLNYLLGTLAGTVGLLVVTMLFIRLLPSGFTGLMMRFTKRQA